MAATATCRAASLAHAPAPRRCVRRARAAAARPVAASLRASAAAAAPKLRKLGDSDLMVNEICLGTMTWGKQNTEEEAHQQLTYAIKERGINFIDTAEMYPVPTEATTQGRTDKYIGSWLKKGEVARDKIILATKVSGASERITWVRDSGKGTRVSAADIKESVDKSLKRLGTDYIDLLQIHWPDRYVSLFGGAAYDPSQERDAVPFEEQLGAFADLVAAGKVRYMGVSNETSWGVTEFSRLARAQPSLPKIVSIQNSYSLLNRGPFEADLVEVCSPRNCNVGLLAYSPLAGGTLSGKYLSGTAPAGARFTLFQGYMERYNKSLAREAVAEYVKVAANHKLTPVELSLAYVRSRSFVTSTIIGATSMEQLKQCIDAFSVELSAEAAADVQRVYRRYRDPATDPQ